MSLEYHHCTAFALFSRGRDYTPDAYGERPPYITEFLGAWRCAHIPDVSVDMTQSLQSLQSLRYVPHFLGDAELMKPVS